MKRDIQAYPTLYCKYSQKKNKPTSLLFPKRLPANCHQLRANFCVQWNSWPCILLILITSFLLVKDSLSLRCCSFSTVYCAALLVCVSVLETRCTLCYAIPPVPNFSSTPDSCFHKDLTAVSIFCSARRLKIKYPNRSLKPLMKCSTLLVSVG